MNTKQEIDKLRLYLTGQIRSAVENEKGCIGTYYKNRGRRSEQSDFDSGNEYGYSLIVGINDKHSSSPSDCEAVTLMEIFIKPENGILSCSLKPDDGDIFEHSIDIVIMEGVQDIIDWLQDANFIPQFNPAPTTLNSESWDFVEHNLPDYHTRYDVYRQGELQLFIDGMSDKDFGMTKEEARKERDEHLFQIFADTIDVFAAQISKP